MHGSAHPHRAGIAWLLADTTLVTAMTVLVKIEGATYPAIQLVFIRSLIGLISILPLAWRKRRAVLETRQPLRHLFRVACNTIALTCNFTALAALPLALVNAIGFVRPLVVLLFAAWLLGERITRVRWIGTAIGFLGILIILAPGAVVWSWGLVAALGSVLFGSLAVIQIRAMANEDTAVLMVFYTVGLSVLTAIPAIMVWEPVAASDWVTLLTIGVLAQLGQYCFLRAYQTTPTAILAPLGYLSIVFASIAGFVFFGDTPTLTTILGVIVILLALQSTNWLEGAALRRRASPSEDR
ncbi:DMT family transporter [Pelagibacterium mangrovi]|uniref:DMT family transporter n=1 Tax=Pelagibacterium mangrovi TaxID=3119828 RepID=UPI002FC940B3